MERSRKVSIQSRERAKELRVFPCLPRPLPSRGESAEVTALNLGRSDGERDIDGDWVPAVLAEVAKQRIFGR
jgi:hypothetical protein